MSIPGFNTVEEAQVVSSLQYEASPTGQAFHESDARVKMIWGPYGSGKSTIVAKDMQIYAMSQEPASDGVRYSRWGVIRASYTQLSIVRKVLLGVLPKTNKAAGVLGVINQAGSPLNGLFKFPLPDGTSVSMEIRMWAVDRSGDWEKFKSEDWTGVWLNEADLIPDGTLEFTISRVGRFPGPSMGGCKWRGILADFNRPITGHHLWRIMDAGKLEFDGTVWDIEVFKQPPAAFKVVGEDGEPTYKSNPEAENLKNLSGGIDYYNVQIASYLLKGASDVVENQFCLLDTLVRSGKAVYPNFSHVKHVAKNEIEPNKSSLIIGYDTSGLHPAASFWQRNEGVWCCVDELYGEDMGLEEFTEGALIPLIRSRYGFSRVILSCDPADAKNSFTAQSPIEKLKEYGLEVHPAYTNSPKIRIQAVASMLNKDIGGIVFSPHCQRSIKAMSGDYHYKKLRIYGAKEELYSRSPDKNSASHIADAIQYFALYIQKASELESVVSPEIASRMMKQRQLRRRIV